MREESQQLFLASIKTNTSRTVHMTTNGTPPTWHRDGLAFTRDSQEIKMLCGKKFDSNKISVVRSADITGRFQQPAISSLHDSRGHRHVGYHGFEPLDWDNYDAGRICSCCMHTKVARISRYKHQVTYEPNWQEFSNLTTVESDGVISFDHNVFTACLSGYYKIVDGLLFSCKAETPGAYPAVRCRNHYNGGLSDNYLFNEHHQYQMFRHCHEELIAAIVELTTPSLKHSFCYMVNKQRILNAVDKILLTTAIFVGVGGNLEVLHDDDKHEAT